ncbi:MAG: hypothetical protein ACRBFS_14425 [Aureispira sp.]
MNSTLLTAGKQFLLIISCLLCLQACDTGAPSIESKQLVGDWLFEKGTIDGGEAGVELLNNLLFSFTETEFHSELLDAMVSGFSKTEPYTIEEKTVIVKEELNLLIKELTDNKLQVSFELSLGGTLKTYDLVFIKQ